MLIFDSPVARRVGHARDLARRWFLYRTRRKSFGMNANVIVDHVEVAGTKYPFSYRYDSEGDRGVVRQIFDQHEYAVDELGAHGAALRQYYQRIVSQGKIPLVLDAGANIGASCLYFSALFPRSHIVAIEPERNNAALLRVNCATRAVRLIEGAIGDAPGTTFLSDPGRGDWGFRVADSGIYPVPLHSPDDILAGYPEDQYAPLIFKVDIEGAEELLFSRNLQWIDQFALLIAELHDWMLPGKRSSRPFLAAICSRDFDFLVRGENVFCFNNALLSYASRWASATI